MADGGSLRRPGARYDAAQPSVYNPAPPVSQSADLDVYSAGSRLRDWARHLADNSSIVCAVSDARVSAGVGAGLCYEPLVRNRKGELLEKLNDAIRRTMDDWSRAADVTGELSRSEVERQCWRAWDVDGEVFARRVYRGRTPQRIGYQVQLIESDLVPYAVISGSSPALGIERDDWGVPLRYHVYPYRPSDVLYAQRVETRPIPAADVRHLRRANRANQSRGVTLFHSVIFRISDIAEYMQAHRLAARASADLFASINRAPDLIEPEPQTDSNGNPIAAREWNFEHLQMIDTLAPGESVNFHTPQHPNQNAVDFIRDELRAIASGCRCAFSWIAQVYDSSYAAQRLEIVDAWRKIEQDRAQFISDLARPMLYESPLQLAIAEGRLPARELRRADPATLFDVRIDGPAMPQIDSYPPHPAPPLGPQMAATLQTTAKHQRIRAMRLPTIQGTPMLPPDAYLLDVAAKPWWQSRTVWSGVITVGASVGALFGIAIPHELTLGIVMSIVSGLSGAGAIYGRVKAARPIRTTRKIGPDEHESMFIGGLD